MAGQTARRARIGNEDGIHCARALFQSSLFAHFSLIVFLFLYMSLPVQAASEWTVELENRATELLRILPAFGVREAAFVALMLGLVAVAATMCLLLVRERRSHSRRERALWREIAKLHGIDDRISILLGSERQLLFSWIGRNDEPRLEGDPSLIGESATAKRVLAFGSWLLPADAAAIERAVEGLRQRGESFRLTIRTTMDAFLEAEGRTVGAWAVLRLRDMTGTRLDVLQAQAELAAVRADLQSMTNLIDGIDHPLWIRDQTDHLVWANQAYLRAIEATGIEDANARMLNLIEADQRKEAQRARTRGERFTARVKTVLAGQRAVLDIAEYPVPAGSAGLAIDISELESARTDLQLQMSAHVRTLDQLPTAVAIFDGLQHLVFANAAYQRLWSLDAGFLSSRPRDSEVLDRLRAQRKLPEQADFRVWKADILSSYRETEARETWWYLPDRRTVRVVVNPNPQGGVTYLFDDVSEHVKLESQVAALIRVQSETLDTLKEGVAVFGTDGRLKLHNRAFADLWTLHAELMAEQPHIDTIIQACRPLAPQEESWTEIRGAVAGLPDMRMGLNCRIDRDDGSSLDCAAQPLPDGATLLTFIDVTASVNVERALTERNEALEKASRLRDEFVHHVSYELRSPLTNIIGFTQLLGDETVGPLNPRQREYAEHIMRSSGSLLTILNDILDLASIDTGSLELVPEIVDIRSTIEAAIRGLEDRLAESAIDIVIDTPDDIGSFVADGKRVRQILFNLLSNAVGFSSPKQVVTVIARKIGDEVMLEVRDRGRGIPPEIRMHIFDRFESHTLGTRHRGVGLGLAIVRSFVELHGGRIELVSTPGKGTTVTCFFPSERLNVLEDTQRTKAPISVLRPNKDQW